MTPGDGMGSFQPGFCVEKAVEAYVDHRLQLARVGLVVEVAPRKPRHEGHHREVGYRGVEGQTGSQWREQPGRNADLFFDLTQCRFPRGLSLAYDAAW